MEHPYEYMTILHFFTLISFGGMPDLGKEEDQLKLTEAIGNFLTDLPKMIGKLPDAEGWTVNSHSTTMIGNDMIYSVLLQRQRS
jgi:hypothetical protein